MDSQLAANILLGVIAIITAAGAVGTVGAFFSMGRSAYRKD